MKRQKKLYCIVKATIVSSQTDREGYNCFFANWQGIQRRTLFTDHQKSCPALAFRL